MQLNAQIAKHLHDVFFGGNWTAANLRDTLTGVQWEQATARVEGFNTILQLTYHIHYFVHVVIPVLQGGKLDAHDKYSFDHPVIASQTDWEQFLARVWADAETLVALIKALPDERMGAVFEQEKYGTYYRNLQGTIEHTHYHLGQIALLKKIVMQ